MSRPFKLKYSNSAFPFKSPVKYERDPREFNLRKGREEIEAMGPRDEQGKYGGELSFIMDKHLEKKETKRKGKEKKEVEGEKKDGIKSEPKWWNPKTQSWE
jgi:hypothetical protein